MLIIEGKSKTLPQYFTVLCSYFSENNSLIFHQKPFEVIPLQAYFAHF